MTQTVTRAMKKAIRFLRDSQSSTLMQFTDATVNTLAKMELIERHSSQSEPIFQLTLMGRNLAQTLGDDE